MRSERRPIYVSYFRVDSGTLHHLGGLFLIDGGRKRGHWKGPDTELLLLFLKKNGRNH